MATYRAFSTVAAVGQILEIFFLIFFLVNRGHDIKFFPAKKKIRSIHEEKLVHPK